MANTKQRQQTSKNIQKTQNMLAIGQNQNTIETKLNTERPGLAFSQTSQAAQMGNEVAQLDQIHENAYDGAHQEM